MRSGSMNSATLAKSGCKPAPLGAFSIGPALQQHL
jgi:hypothetical protein